MTDSSALDAFEQLARELARGDEILTDRLLVVVAAAGRTMADLERRLAAVEVDIAEIYRSRTWRALTRVGGLLQGVGKTLRPRRNGNG